MTVKGLILHNWNDETEKDDGNGTVTIKKSDLKKQLKNVKYKDKDFKRHSAKAISETKDTLTYNVQENPLVCYTTQSVDLDYTFTEEDFVYIKNSDGTKTLKNPNDAQRIGKTKGQDFKDNWNEIKIHANKQKACDSFNCNLGKSCLGKIRTEMIKKGLTVSEI